MKTILSLGSRMAANLRRLVPAMALGALLALATGGAQAAIYNLPGAIGSGPFSSCSRVSGTTTYRCTGSVELGSNNTIGFTENMTLEIQGNFKVDNNTVIAGNLHAVTIITTGDIDLGNSLTSSVNFSAGGNFEAGNSAVITGSISAVSDVTLGNNAVIVGNVNAGDNLSVGSGIIIGSCTYQTTNYQCGGGTGGVGSFTVTPSATSASTCAVAGGSPAAPWITITAKHGTGGSGTTVTGYTGTVTISGIGSGALAIRTGSGTLTGNSYTFVPVDNGVVQLYLIDPTAESITPVATAGTATGTSTSAIAFSDNVLVVADADALTPTYQPVAGRGHKLGAAIWRKDPTSGNCSINTAFNSSAAAKLWMTTGSSHPTGAAAPTVATSNSCLGAFQLPATAPSTTNITLAFASGQAFFYLCTTDVGQYQVNVAADTLPGSAKLPVASNLLTTVPFAIVVSGIQQGGSANGGASAADGTVFAKAGSEFQATVAAYRWNSAADTSASDGVPDGGATFTNATGGGLVPSYAQTVTLSATTPITPATAATPPGGTLGSLANGAVAVTGGSATVTNLSYSEVGSFTLGAVPAPNYLGVADLSSRVLIYSTAAQSQNGIVGRFKPDRFITSVTQGCPAGSFTYSRQPFKVDIQAVNAGGAVTKNYDGALGFAKAVTLSPSNSAAGDLAPTAVPASSFSAGIASPTETLDMGTYWRSPQTTRLPASETTGGDSVASVPADEGSATIRSGRVRLMSASGSELLDLPMTMRVEFWRDATGGWTLNADDTCTGNAALPFPPDNAVSVSKTNATLPAAAFTAMCAYDSGSPGLSSIGCGTPGPASKQFLEGGAAAFAGNFNLNFQAPGLGNSGTMDVTANVPAWLRYPWTSATAGNPTAKATFGKVRNSAVIFRREVY
ncbi:MAG: LamG protein [Rhodocyclaceae bacterium]|nr:LamG protein [Rhodocyclaceae bacterium]